MEHYGIRGSCLDWVRDYLTNRKIRVKINSNGNVCTSKEEFINIGTRQGSNLGPLLFSIIVNEIYLTLDHCTCILYADDTTIYYASADVNEIKRSLQSDLTKLIEWFKANKLSINLGKTKYVIFNPRMINAIDTEKTEKIKIGNITIDRVDEFKFLGIIFDSELSWKAHASALESKLSMSKFLLRASENILTKKLLHDVYYTHFYSHLIYGIETWGPMMSKKNLDGLFKIQKSTVCIITNSKCNAHTDPIFRNNKLLKLNDIIKFHMCKFGYKLYRKIHPHPLLNIFTKISEGLSRNRWVTHHMNIPIICKHSSKFI